jgi:hypothetical protein
MRGRSISNPNRMSVWFGQRCDLRHSASRFCGAASKPGAVMLQSLICVAAEP